MNPQDVPALVRELGDAWQARDLDRFLSLLTDDVVWTDPAIPVPAQGRGAVRRFAETVLRAFPDFVDTIRHPICVAADGSRCAVPWRITATASGHMDPPGFAPTGRRVEFEGVDLLEFRAGRVSRIDTLFDPRVPIEQLLACRLRPAPGSLRERAAVWAQRARAAWLRWRYRGPGAR